MQRNQKPLTPRQVFCAIIAGLEEKGCTQVLQIPGDEFQLPTPMACIYENPKNRTWHIVYYPGKDNDEVGSEVSLKKIKELVDTKIALYMARSDMSSVEKYANANEYFVVAESNYFASVPGVAKTLLNAAKSNLLKANHFVVVAARKDPIELAELIDSMPPRDYDTSYIKEAVGVGRLLINNRGQQELTNDWQCGYYAIENTVRAITDAAHSHGAELTDGMIREHQVWLDTGLKKFGLVAAQDDITEPAQPAKTFWQRHPLAKRVLIGVAIGIGVLIIVGGLVALTILTAGLGIPALAGVAAALGSAFGVVAGAVGGAAAAWSLLTAGALFVGALFGAGIAAVSAPSTSEQPLQPINSKQRAPEIIAEDDFVVIEEAKATSKDPRLFSDPSVSSTTEATSESKSTPTPRSAPASDDEK